MAGIVTFNPDSARLAENLAAIAGAVDEIVIVDNNSANAAEVVALAGTFPHVRVIRHDENLGMAVALNTAMGWAADSGADWVMLLDQDSVCGVGMVAGLSELAAPGVGIIAPEIVDRNIDEVPPLAGDPEDVNHCITSGALFRVAAWQAVGGYDTAMFMDFIDFDYCLRLRIAGWRIVATPQVFLLHEVGASVRHGRFVSYNHSATRGFHMARDMLYYAKKNRKAPRELTVHRPGVLFVHLLLLRKSLIIAAFEQDAPRRILALAQGSIAATFRESRLPR